MGVLKDTSTNSVRSTPRHLGIKEKVLGMWISGKSTTMKGILIAFFFFFLSSGSLVLLENAASHLRV